MRPLFGTCVLIALVTSSSWARAQCRQDDVVAVDRSRFFPTIQRALSVLEMDKIAGIPLPYREGANRQQFAARVAARNPKLVIAHFSMFAPGDRRRGRYLSDFFAELERSEAPPMAYAVYSSAFRPGGLDLKALRDAGLFEGIEDERLTLIYVPDGRRFHTGRGDVELRHFAQSLVPRGLCAG